MIARKNPGKWIWDKPLMQSVAAQAYGMTLTEFKDAAYSFLQCEGCHPDDGHECQDLHEYLTYQPKPERIEPYQKGDESLEGEFSEIFYPKGESL